MPSGEFVQEWYFESTATCLIPITSEKAINDKSISFSFHNISENQIRCYMNWNGQIHRIFNDTLMQTLKSVFVPKIVKQNDDQKEPQFNIKDEMFPINPNS